MLSRRTITRKLNKGVSKSLLSFARYNHSITSTTTPASLQPHIELTTFANGLRLITDSTPGHFSAVGRILMLVQDTKILRHQDYLICAIDYPGNQQKILRGNKCWKIYRNWW